MENYITKTTKFGDFMFFMPYLLDEVRESNIEKLNKAPKPKHIFGSDVPDDLNLISFGQYSDLCDILGQKEQDKIIVGIIEIMFPNVSKEQMNNSDAYDIWGYCNWVISEVNRINKLFSAIKIDYTPQEKKAGIEKLQFGTFGILDWYAKRMGITDQNQVNSEKWVRIFQCMKNDNEEAEFNRRLQKVYENEAKHK